MEEGYGLQHGGTLPPAARGLVAACNDLGLGLLRELLKAGEGRNLLVSPFALSLALAVLYNGAGGDTRRVLRGVLGAHDIGDEEFNAAYLSLRRLLTGGTDVTLSVASALWVREGLRFDASFVQAVGHYYGAEAAPLDFDSPTARDAVNQWVREQTAGKIGGVIESDDVSPATDLVLASIAYFKGQWANPFDRASTREALFHLLDGRSRSVPMMHQEGSFEFYQTPLFQAVRLPYGDGRLSMDLLLPAPDSSPAELLKSADAQVWGAWDAGMRERRLALHLPRFESGFEIETKRHLAALGLGNLFGVEADFKPMGMEGHFVEKIKQKAVIEVNEEGTEAAAANIVMMGRSLPPSLTIAFNRPFFWAIRDSISGALMFAGQVMEL